MKEYIEANVKIDRMTSNGAMKQQRERYVVDAINFTEAERRLMEEVGAYGDGEFSVSDMKRVQYMEIFQTQDDSADKFFKVKISIITLTKRAAKSAAQPPTSSCRPATSPTPWSVCAKG